ncbi:MAG TPA: hypothetical protein VNJ08_13475 [Bacteriovoracaceae bacterium]|nr:hypothetical protein [Bacteriovoracaceae bacterium]
MFKLTLMLLLLISCSHKFIPNNKVTIIKQWHLSPTVQTTDFKNSSGLPQYLNQRDIYIYLYKLVNDHPEKVTIIAEGCDAGTIIDKNFEPTYNGWNAKNLLPHREQLYYSEILTFLPLKLKMQFPDQVTSICGDSEELARQNQLAISEAKGFLGFHMRLKDTVESSPKKYQGYLKALEEIEKRKIIDPIAYTKQAALKQLEVFNELIKKRNSVLSDTAGLHINNHPVIIVGGLHAKNLEVQLKQAGYEVSVHTPQGYPANSENLGQDLIKALEE